MTGEGILGGFLLTFVACAIIGIVYEHLELTECRLNNVALTATIESQNLAVEEAHKESEAIQTAINTTEVNNSHLTAAMEKTKAAIQKIPSTGTCEQAIAWGAKQTAIVAGHWQTVAS